jgi:hypothetical protein
MPLKPQNTTSAGAQSFDKSLTEDITGFHKKPNDWTQARNAVNNTERGDIGHLSNEQSNKFCAAAPYTIIGAVHVGGDKFVLYSTNNTDSEIGVFDESECSYNILVNDQCLNFHIDSLITGQSKENFECQREVYWSDGRNPDRVLNIHDIPWKQDCQTVNDCVECVDLPELDCDRLRLEPLVNNLKFSVAPGATSGELLNGSYFVAGAYLINGQRFGDFSMPSQVQGLWTHQNTASSIDVTIEYADPRFDEIEIVIQSFENYQQLAKRVGVYSTRQKLISIDSYQSNWPDVNPGDILINNPIDDKSDSIWRNGDYLIRVGPTSKFDFNYQPIANQIKTEWVSVEYPEYYYGDGGNNTGYMRDEVYAFFIRWVYNTGDKSPSFHIPGRFQEAGDFTLVGGRDGAVDVDDGLDPYAWRVNNTSSSDVIAPYTLPDGGTVIGKGSMGYWESVELYDDDTPQIWNATYTDPQTGVNIGGTQDTRYDLCGKPIRHHRFPSNADDQLANHPATHHVNAQGNKIRIMGVQFSNIKRPLDNKGNEITNVVGYEILRGSREGNKSVFFKGMLCNLREYEIVDDTNTRQGLYQNYPYNNLGKDPFLCANKPVIGQLGFNPAVYTNYRKDAFSFHSPDTNFKDPYLSAKEVKIYGEVWGAAANNFQLPIKHPKFKFVTDGALLAAMIMGLAVPIVANVGKRKKRLMAPYKYNMAQTFLGPAGGGSTPVDLITATGPSVIAMGVADGLAATARGLAVNDVTILAGAFLGSHPEFLSYQVEDPAKNAGYSVIPGVTGSKLWEEADGGDLSGLGVATRGIIAVSRFIINYQKGIDMWLDILRNVSPPRNHAVHSLSHCFFDRYKRPQQDNNRRAVKEQAYIGPALVDWSSFRINNIFRTRFVAVQTGATANNNRFFDNPLTTDTACINIEDAGNLPNGPNQFEIDNVFQTVGSAHYAGLKQRIRNQYGQVQGVIQVPVSTGTTDKNRDVQFENGPSASEVLFNGDIYIGRYTEKNTILYFYDWLYDVPDNTPFNYFLRQNISWVTYWMDTEPFDIAEFTSSLDLTDLWNILTGGPVTIALPSTKHNFDKSSNNTGFFLKKNAYIHLFNSSVKDFYVESEVNIDYRDWGDLDQERHYDPKRYTHLPSLFSADPKIIKSGNHFKYDWSLSISRLYNNFVAWGNTQDREYNPQVAEKCYTYRPNRVTYSLPQRSANKQDFWRIFLPYNYKDFTAHPRAVKQFSKNGALILFDSISPISFAGVDQLTTDGDTKITIGDGGLFSQPMQNLANAEWPIEYGSCQDKFSAINTPAGFYYMSQNQGKIFTLTGGSIAEISNQGMKWWFAEYLPYKLTEDFPDFELTDNPVGGIGCQTIYDNKNQVVYFCKKDYQLKKDLPESMRIVYSGESDIFYLNGRTPIKLGDPLYFNSASWTVSYDPKVKAWISYHDWHPDLTITSKNTFLSTKGDGVWDHNNRCDSYCNFYGADYPFEVEMSVHTSNVVNTLRNVEYYMEAYKYAENCYDRFHDLDFNFDESIIYNSEQVSGLLKLSLMPKNNVAEILEYPKVNTSNIDILYSKEEQKYRFNQFWDITDDRGEFNSQATRTIFETEPNGYIRNLNPNNLNYNKPQIERKKFRHYKNTVFLRRKVSGDRNMVVATAVKMNLKSPR